MSTCAVHHPTIHPRLQGYAPCGLSDAQWARLRDPVVELVTVAGPSSDEDAKQLAGALCALLAAELASNPGAGLDDLLTVEAVARQVTRLRPDHVLGTVQNTHARLTRLLRAFQGLPGPDRGPARAGREPMTVAGVAERLGQVNTLPHATAAVLRRRLVLAVAAGLIDRDADQARIVAGPDGPVVVTASGARPLLAAVFRHLLVMVEPRPADSDPGTWARARSEWTALYGPWDSDRTRDAWTTQVLALGLPGATLITAAGLTYRAIDRIDLGPAGRQIDSHRDSLRG